MSATVPLALIEQKAAELVRRSRAGDQNAMGMIKQVGAAARLKPGTIAPDRLARAQAAFTAIKRYIAAHPIKAAASELFGADAAGRPAAPVKKRDPELAKPPLPRGIFDGLFEPERFEIIVVRACKYRHGLPAAAVVLASGPPLIATAVQEIGMSTFGSDARSACFFHGVKFCGEKDWVAAAPSLDPARRRSLAVGQCVGRARRLQMLRQPDSEIGLYTPMIGWELGE